MQNIDLKIDPLSLIELQIQESNWDIKLKQNRNFDLFQIPQLI